MVDPAAFLQPAMRRWVARGYSPWSLQGVGIMVCSPLNGGGSSV